MQFYRKKNSEKTSKKGMSCLQMSGKGLHNVVIIFSNALRRIRDKFTIKSDVFPLLLSERMFRRHVNNSVVELK